jgi:hypothetical protein
MIPCVFALFAMRKNLLLVEVSCLKNDPPAKDIIAGGYWIKSGFQNEFGLLGLVFRINGSLDFLEFGLWFFWTNWTYGFSGFGSLVSFFGYWIRFLGSGLFPFSVLVIHIN